MIPPNPWLLLAVLVKRAGGEVVIERSEFEALDGKDLDLAVGMFPGDKLAMRVCTPATRGATMAEMDRAHACPCEKCTARRREAVH